MYETIYETYETWEILHINWLVTFSSINSKFIRSIFLFFMCKTLQLHWISACKSDTHVKIKTSDSQVGHVGRSLLIIQNLCLFKLRPFKQSTFWVWMLSEAKRNVSLQRISRHIFCWQQQEITWPLQIDLIDSLGVPSWELTYPPKMAFWRWFSFSPGGIC